MKHSVSSSEVCLETWKRREALAEGMIPIIGTLYRDHNIISTLFDRRLVNTSVPGILQTHQHASKDFKTTLHLSNTDALLRAVAVLAADNKVGAMRFDAAKAAEACEAVLSAGSSAPSTPELVDAVAQHLLSLGIGQVACEASAPRDVVLYGFGRIGRLVARLLIEKTGDGQKLLLRAIVVRPCKVADLAKRADLLMRDSVHGVGSFTVSVVEDQSALLINGNLVHVIHSPSPEMIDYEEYGIHNAVVIDNTGIWRDEVGLGKHLVNGASQVLLTAPGSGVVKNIVMGVNDDKIGTDTIVSAASCTTNAIAPVLKAMHDRFGVVSGHVESVHSYTNDQNLLDNFHAKARRGRAAPLNLVLTETGAGKAVGKCLPELQGKLTSSAIRVPTPNVSLAILMLQLDEEVESADVINSYLRGVALRGDLRHQIEVSGNTEAVSSDFVGNRHTSVVDEVSTISEGKRCVLYVWFDNEFGYSCQVVRLLQSMSNIEHPEFPTK